MTPVWDRLATAPEASVMAGEAKYPVRVTWAGGSLRQAVCAAAGALMSPSKTASVRKGIAEW
jgi:hypothetical protein